MTTTDRLLALLPAELERYRAAIDATPGINSVTLTVQLDRLGVGRDRIIVTTESGYLPKERV